MSDNLEFGSWPDNVDARHDAIEQSIQNLARKGLIVDSGRWRWRSCGLVANLPIAISRKSLAAAD
jgi:hypothetical protein